MLLFSSNNCTVHVYITTTWAEQINYGSDKRMDTAEYELDEICHEASSNGVYWIVDVITLIKVIPCVGPSAFCHAHL